MNTRYLTYFGLIWFFTIGISTKLRAQVQAQNWHFGDHAAIRFGGSGGPVALINSAMLTSEGCTTLSDINGQLLAYSNGEAIWDNQHQMMPNGSAGLGGNNSTSQGALLLPMPGSLTKAYLFCTDAIEYNLVGGLRYSIVDFTLRNGLGDVTATRGVVLPTPVVGGKVTEKLTAVRHANGRDYWIVVHGWQSNAFYAFLLSPTGISALPTTSNVGVVHQGGGSFFGAANAVGCMQASPDGRHLALAQRDSQCEMYDFDNATGTVSNYLKLASHDYTYGVAFSPDNSKLYTTYSLDGQIIQYNLLAGSPAGIVNSATVITSAERLGSLQLGPDNKLYVVSYGNAYLNVIQNPNAAGAACAYQPRAVSLAGRLNLNGLPSFPNAFGNIALTLAFTSNASCVGSAVAFVGTLQPTLTGAVATWNFGDPASGSANVATGLAPTHTYAVAGTYQVTLVVAHPALAAPATITQAVTVAPRPVVQLGGNVTLCGSQLLLTAGTQPAGSTYRWQDGSTAATYLARTSGRYRVAVTSAAGCTSADSMQLVLNAVPVPRLPADTTACSASVLLRLGVQPAGSTYHWQDGSSSATYLATASGTYTVLVTTPQGCTGTASSRVQLGAAPTVSLGTDTLVCPNAVWTLRPSPQPAGTLYRWQDGSTAATYLAHGPGQYSVEVRATAAGCSARATRTATAISCPVFIPNIITPNGDPQNEFFVLKGLKASEWHLSVFDRWGRQVHDQARYDNHWNATGEASGLYYYMLSNAATGERYRGWVEVQRSN